MRALLDGMPQLKELRVGQQHHSTKTISMFAREDEAWKAVWAREPFYGLAEMFSAAGSW